MKCDVMMTRVMLKVAVYNRYTGCRCHAEGAVCVYSPACGGCSGLLGDLSSVTHSYNIIGYHTLYKTRPLAILCFNIQGWRPF